MVADDLVAALNSDVEELLRRVADEAILPRFRQLRDGEVKEKTPGEFVTVADHEAEAMLTEQLSALLPGSRVAGEEACAANPSVLERLDEGLVWVVDPLDGTAHFAAGREPFGTMVALAADGETLGGWIYNPVRQLMYTGARGQGAFVSDARGALNGLGSDDFAADFRSVRGENLYPNIAGAAVIDVPHHGEPAICEWNDLRRPRRAAGVGVDGELGAYRESCTVDDSGMNFVKLG